MITSHAMVQELHSLEKHVFDFLTSHTDIKKNTVIVAVSGGLDSMTLLSITYRLFINGNIEALHALHVNHGLRSAESDEDEKWVKEWCKKNKIRFTSRSLAWDKATPSEDALRKARYTIFENIVHNHPSSVLLTAHHLDDQLETFLMRLFKGSRLKGLGGIPQVRGSFLRPLLAIPRRELKEYAQAHNIRWREDATNKDVSILRNAIRHKLLPVIEEIFGPDADKAFLRGLSDIIEAQRLLERMYGQRFSAMVKRECSRAICSVKSYGALEPMEKRLFWNYCFSYVYPVTFRVSDAFTERVSRFIQNAVSGRRYNAAAGVDIVRGRESFAVCARKPKTAGMVKLKPGGDVAWGCFKIKCIIHTEGMPEFTSDSTREYINGDRITAPLIIRKWQKGDRFRPVGMTHFKKVSDFFTDQKLDPWEKESIPIVLSGKEIVWLAGCRLDDRFKVTSETQKIYTLEVEKIV